MRPFSRCQDNKSSFRELSFWKAYKVTDNDATNDDAEGRARRSTGLDVVFHVRVVGSTRRSAVRA